MIWNTPKSNREVISDYLTASGMRAPKEMLDSLSAPMLLQLAEKGALAQSAFYLSEPPLRNYFGEEVPQDSTTFPGLEMLVVLPIRKEAERARRSSMNVLQLVEQSSQTTFHLAICSLPPMWLPDQFCGSFALLSLMTKDSATDEWKFGGIVRATDEETMEYHAAKGITVAPSYLKARSDTRLQLWGKKEGKDLKQDKDFPIPLLIRRLTHIDGTIGTEFRLVVTFHWRHDWSILVDSQDSPCMSFTNPFRWVSKPASTNLAKRMRPEETTARPASATISPPNAAFDFSDLQHLLSQMRQEDFSKIVLQRFHDREERCAMFGLRSPAATDESFPYLTTLDQLQHGDSIQWFRCLQAVAYHIGKLQRCEEVWSSEISFPPCRNVQGGEGRYNQIIFGDVKEAQSWLHDLEINHGLLATPSIHQTRTRLEEIGSILTSQSEYRCNSLWSLRDIYPASIGVDSRNPEHIYYLASHDVDKEVRLEDRLILLCRIVHTARIPLHRVEDVLFVPYMAGRNGVPREHGRATISHLEKRKFYLMLHAAFLDFHLYHIHLRNGFSVVRFRKALHEQDNVLKSLTPDYFVPGVERLSPWT